MNLLPEVGAKVKILAGPKSGQVGTVDAIASSQWSPIAVKAGDRYEWYRPEELELLLEPEPEPVVSETEAQARERREDANYITALFLALDAVLGVDAPVRDRIDGVTLQIAHALDQKDKEARK